MIIKATMIAIYQSYHWRQIMATAYTIRDFPQDLHRRAKAKAALEGVSLRELILKAIAEYIEQKEEE
jgi:predicted HicB family RNase H-like nuclease